LRPLPSILCLLLVLGSCASGPPLDFELLRSEPPLPFALGLTGGTFLPVGQRGVEDSGPEGRTLAARTWPEGVVEPLPLSRILGILRRGRAASVLLDLGVDDRTRERAALGLGGDPRGRLMEIARKRKCDLVLLIEGARDAPVQSRGVNGQWPIAALGWVLIGLGGFVPDHDFEARVRLAASLLDVHTGRELDRIFVEATPFSLSLFQRASLLGILGSVLIPPPLIGDEVSRVVAHARARGEQELLLRLLARLKLPETREAIQRGQSFRISLARIGPGRLRLDIECRQELAGLSFDLNGDPWSPPSAWEEAFLLDPKPMDETLLYSRELPRIREGSILRVLARTVAGEVSSTTLRLERER